MKKIILAFVFAMYGVAMRRGMSKRVLNMSGVRRSVFGIHLTVLNRPIRIFWRSVSG